MHDEKLIDKKREEILERIERNLHGENQEKPNLLKILFYWMAIIGILLFFVIGCAMFRKAEDKSFAETSMFCPVEYNSYWTVYYHKDTKVMYIRNKGTVGSNDIEVLIDENGNPMLWSE